MVNHVSDFVFSLLGEEVKLIYKTVLFRFVIVLICFVLLGARVQLKSKRKKEENLNNQI